MAMKKILMKNPLVKGGSKNCRTFPNATLFKSAPPKVPYLSSHSTFPSEYHRLSRFEREMGALPSLDTVMLLTYIKLSGEFNPYDEFQKEKVSPYPLGYPSDSFLPFRLRHCAAD
jgi:hypothetical protein